MPPSSLGQDTRLPLYQRLRDDILARIAAGQWQPDTPIPTEQELARLHGIAIGTVRKAVDTLVADGTLQRSQGRGTFVRRPDFAASFLRFIRHIGPDGAPVVPESRVLNCATVPAPAQASAALDLAPEAPVLALQRLRSVNGEPASYEEIWLPLPRFEALSKLAPEAFSNLLYPFYESCCGQVVASARETLGVAAASAALAERLAIPAGAPVVSIARTARGYDRTPLEFRISWAAAASFRYEIDIN